VLADTQKHCINLPQNPVPTQKPQFLTAQNRQGFACPKIFVAQLKKN
jgi:hypothetical protein